MAKSKRKMLSKFRGLTLPLFIEKEEDGFYVAECPILEGCYAQGKTIDEALKNIREVIEMILEEFV
jgi:predicted RNase H-like HicB family nuclease